MSEQTTTQPVPAPAVDPRKGCTSASNALPDSLCPGRHLAQQGLPDPESEWSRRGSAIHAALAGWPGALEKLSLAERETYDACQAIEVKLLRSVFGDAAPGLRCFRETQDGKSRLWGRLQVNGALLEHSAQPDVIYRLGLRAAVFEYKTLPGDVPQSPRNLQLRDQAVLIAGNFVPTEEVVAAVIQPMVTHSPVPCSYDKEALARATKEMWDRVIASNKPGSPRVAGQTQCHYCKATRYCVEYQKFAGAITPPAMLTILEVPMTAWTPEQRQRAAEALGPAAKFLEDLKDYLKEGLSKDPAFCPGWMLEPGSKRRTITNPQTCFTRFQTLGGTLDQFMPAVKVGITDLRNALSILSGAKGKALDAALKTLTEGIIEEKQSAPSLKRAGE